ncbi:MAG: glycosyltransferase family 1 protein [Pedosphaera sp.]|nr:glycosyltransferase family 1 protein [Pedosphaera sp.]
MKILMVCTSWRVFGAEAMSLNILSGLRERGHEVVAVTSTWTDGEFGRRLVSLGLREVRLPMGALVLRPSPRGLWWTANALAYLPSVWRGFSRLAKSFRPDAVILTNPRQGLLLYPFLGRRPAFLIEHSDKAVNFPNRKMYRLLGRKLANFIATSDQMARHLSKLGVTPEKIRVIKIGAFSETKLREVDQVAAARGREAGDVFRIGIAGQISAHKGHDCLVQAAERLKARGRNFVVEVFGSGSTEYVERLKGKIAAAGLNGCWRWMGYESDLSRVYGNLDVCAVPSCFDEPFGMVAVEASAYGLPVIASRRGGLPEIVVDGETGWLVTSDAPAELAAKLEWLMDDPVRARAMGDAGRRRVRELFTIEKTAAEIESLLRGAVGGANQVS